MNIHLPPEFERLVENKVENGGYASASEVIQEALRMMSEQDEFLKVQRDAIRQKIAAGHASLQRGEGIDGEEAFRRLNELRASLRRGPGG